VQWRVFSSHVSDSVSNDPLGDNCIKVSSVGVESGGPYLDIDGTVFADAVLVEPEGENFGAMPMLT
jgi:hypothetical protein